MDRKTMWLLLVVGVFLVSMITAVYAQRSARGQDVETIAKPTQTLGISAVTEGVSFIMAGGIGPILILVIAFIVGMIISHLVWGGF